MIDCKIIQKQLSQNRLLKSYNLQISKLYIMLKSLKRSHELHTESTSWNGYYTYYMLVDWNIWQANEIHIP